MVGDITLAGFTFLQDDWLMLDDESHAEMLMAWVRPPAPTGGEEYYAEYELHVGAG